MKKVEALFLDPSFLRQGLGQAMIAHARALKGPLQVDVNEENVAAGAFYESCGFIRQGRSACDSAGKPHALLHLAQTT
jgi:putative acetyltransferase